MVGYLRSATPKNGRFFGKTWGMNESEVMMFEEIPRWVGRFFSNDGRVLQLEFFLCEGFFRFSLW